MKNSKIIILAILILTLLFSSTTYIQVNAAEKTNTEKVKVAGYIYNGPLKLKSNKYGIDIKQKDGTKKFVAFDTKGQKLAKSLVTKKEIKVGTEITVNGTIKKNVLQVISVVKKETKAETEQTFTGWLGDSDCSPNLEDPTAMSSKCLKCPHCEASGYGISIKQTDGTYKYFKFDENGHKLAKENIVDKTKEKKVPAIIVKGTLDGNIIKVKSITLD